jgi:hypothetical protein
MSRHCIRNFSLSFAQQSRHDRMNLNHE